MPVVETKLPRPTGKVPPPRGVEDDKESARPTSSDTMPIDTHEERAVASESQPSMPDQGPADEKTQP
jgi:hypothetical protein